MALPTLFGATIPHIALACCWRSSAPAAGCAPPTETIDESDVAHVIAATTSLPLASLTTTCSVANSPMVRVSGHRSHLASTKSAGLDAVRSAEHAARHAAVRTAGIERMDKVL